MGGNGGFHGDFMRENGGVRLDDTRKSLKIMENIRIITRGTFYLRTCPSVVQEVFLDPVDD